MQLKTIVNGEHRILYVQIISGYYPCLILRIVIWNDYHIDMGTFNVYLFCRSIKMFTVCRRLLLVRVKKSVGDFAIENEKNKIWTSPYVPCTSCAYVRTSRFCSEQGPFDRAPISIKVKRKCLSPRTFNCVESTKSNFVKNSVETFLDSGKHGQRLE